MSNNIDVLSNLVTNFSEICLPLFDIVYLTYLFVFLGVQIAHLM